MNYARVIDLRTAHALLDQHPGFPIWQLAFSVEEEMRKIERFRDPYFDLEFEDIRIAFAEMARKFDATEQDFDNLMERLYNWGELRATGGQKVCWVRIV